MCRYLVIDPDKPYFWIEKYHALFASVPLTDAGTQGNHLGPELVAHDHGRTVPSCRAREAVNVRAQMPSARSATTTSPAPGRGSGASRQLICHGPS
jgi:hypothetical protein